MQLHELQPKHISKRKKRKGRGGKKGAYSGHGIKGQRSRSGRRFKPAIRELIKRYPKLRGSGQKLKIKNQKLKVVVLNLEMLEKKFNAGEKVSSEILLEKRLIRKSPGKTVRIKILGKGEITKALNFENCQVSKQTKEKIEKAGGTVKISKIKN